MQPRTGPRVPSAVHASSPGDFTRGGEGQGLGLGWGECHSALLIASLVLQPLYPTAAFRAAHVCTVPTSQGL